MYAKEGPIADMWVGTLLLPLQLQVEVVSADESLRHEKRCVEPTVVAMEQKTSSPRLLRIKQKHLHLPLYVFPLESGMILNIFLHPRQAPLGILGTVIDQDFFPHLFKKWVLVLRLVSSQSRIETIFVPLC